jgi:hypothetical protein
MLTTPHQTVDSLFLGNCNHWRLLMASLCGGGHGFKGCGYGKLNIIHF